PGVQSFPTRRSSGLAAVGLDDLELDQPVVQRALVAQGGAALAPVHGEVHHARGALVLVVVPDPVGGEGFDTHVSLQWAKVGGGRSEEDTSELQSREN